VPEAEGLTTAGFCCWIVHMIADLISVLPEQSRAAKVRVEDLMARSLEASREEGRNAGFA